MINVSSALIVNLIFCCQTLHVHSTCAFGICAHIYTMYADNISLCHWISFPTMLVYPWQPVSLAMIPRSVQNSSAFVVLQLWACIRAGLAEPVFLLRLKTIILELTSQLTFSLSSSWLYVHIVI
jgi:hypothetical protein